MASDNPRLLAPANARTRRAGDPLGVRFLDCDAGWIRFTIDSLVVSGDHIAATHLDDPFPAMMTWLEAICDGAPVASWTIAQEGASARLIYSGEHGGWLGGGSERLVYIGEGDQLYGFASSAVRRRKLVREFYTVFCAFTCTMYQPAEWEDGLPLGVHSDDLSDEEDEAWTQRWDGNPLRRLRSAKIESYLRGDRPAQLTFDWNRHR